MFFQDLQFGARQLLRSPGFLIVAVLSLALGIGANSAIFSVLNSVLLKKLPVREPDKLVMLTDPGAAGMATGKWDGERGLLAYPEFEDFQREGSLFEGLCAVESYSSRLLAHVDGDNEEIWSKLASASYFSVLGVTPETGRFFDAGVDKQLGTAPYAVISDSYWDRRFGRNAQAIGKTITIAKTALTIIGVAPREFGSETVGQKPDIWAPLSMQLQLMPDRDLLHPLHDPTEKAMWLHVFGRLKPGVTLSQASVQANVIFERNLEASYQSVSAARKKEFMNQRLKLHEAATGASDLRESFTQASYILFAAVGITLLICCANVTNLLLARANSRQREIMVRLALGANKKRIVSQLFTESLLLALLGAGGGLLIAGVAAPLMMRAPATPSEPVEIDPTLDWRVLAFTGVVAIVTTIIFGLVPAMRAAKMDINSPLREGSRNATATAGKLRLGKIFVIGQVALSLILVVGAGLLLRSVLNLQNTDLGYARDKMLMVQVDGAKAGYQGEERMLFYRRIFEKLQAIPGVRKAAFSKLGLFSGGDSSDQIEVEGHTAHGKNDRGSSWDEVGPGYFSVLGIPISLGREINDRDQLGGPLVCVINEAFRKLFFEGRNPIGKGITDVYGDERVTFEVVGVAANSRDHNLRGEVPPRFFMAAAQHAVGNDVPRGMDFELRTLAQPASVTNAVRQAMAGIDRDAPFEVRSLGEIVTHAVEPDRMLADLVGIFGGLALLLAGVGIYGVMAYGVSQRTGEIGIRIAVGAAFNDVVAIVLREAFVMVAVGLVVGLLGAVWVTELIRSQLVGITPTDPLVIGCAVGAMVLIGLLAAFVPAWRASRVDPITALRYE
jgi:predicted permease